MSARRQLYELSRRDFLQRARSKAFLVMMLLTVGLIFTVGPLIALLTDDPDPAGIGIVGSPPAGIEDALAQSAAALDIEIDTSVIGTRAEGETALRESQIDVLVVDGSELVWRENSGARLAAAVVGAYAAVARSEAAAELGLSLTDVERLLEIPEFSETTLIEPDPEKEPRQAAAFVGLMVLYISILMFGQFVLMGVMEEKQNRVVEVVLSRVRPWQVLAGKVIGVGVLGLAQITVLGAAALLALSLVDVADVDLGSIGIELLAWVILWYLLGYAFYSMLYGALGATISRQEDMQGAVMFPVLLIVPGFFFGQVAAASPDAVLPRIASLIPLWSPMVMPVRTAVSDVALIEVALSVLLVIAGVYVLTVVGGRIYAGAILKIGSRVKLLEAWRTARG